MLYSSNLRQSLFFFWAGSWRRSKIPKMVYASKSSGSGDLIIYVKYVLFMDLLKSGFWVVSFGKFEKTILVGEFIRGWREILVLWSTVDIFHLFELLIQVLGLIIDFLGCRRVPDLSDYLNFLFWGGQEFLLFFNSLPIHIIFNVQKISPMER